MKRSKIYKPRRGIRFDNRRIATPDGSFIGSDVQVIHASGAVMDSLEQDPGTYRYPTVPFAGYPKTAGEMQQATAGIGTWLEGYLFEEPAGTSGLTSSFDQTDTLDKISGADNFVQHSAGYGILGLGDKTISYDQDGSAGYAYARYGNTASFELTSTTDLMFMYVAYVQSTGAFPNNFGTVCNKRLVNGWSVGQSTTAASPGTVVLNMNINDGTNYNATSTARRGVWFAALGVVERGAINKLSMSHIDLSTRIIDVSTPVDISAVSSILGDASYVGVGGNLNLNVPNGCVCSALYMTSGSAVASGAIGNEEKMLASFANVLLAKNGYMFTGSLEAERSIGTFGSERSSRLLNNRLLGLGTASLGRSRGFTAVVTSSIPSWTNRHIRNSSFVVTTLSASDHETHVLNSYKSGTEPLESTEVPASRSLYFSKRSGYYNVVVKKTASYLDLGPTTDGHYRPVSFHPDKGTVVSYVTGVAGTTSRTLPPYPAVFDIEVPYSGKIVDMKVWVEIMHVTGSGKVYDIGNTGIALRSPNVKWGHAHPIRNDTQLKKVFTSQVLGFSALGNSYSSFFGPNSLDDFYHDTFLLWESVGWIIDAGPWDVTPGSKFPLVSGFYPTFQRDRSIRTIFSDGARIPNPRRNVRAGTSASYDGAPNSYFGINCATGMDVPWWSETEYSGSNTYAAAGSPPDGWLNGPGGTNLDNEWPTTGSNYGADEIQPVYPLLDPLYQRKVYGDDLAIYTPSSPELYDLLFKPEEWTGFRPGLRGTEVSGTWQLLIYDNNTTGYDYPAYFRQVRLEFTLCSGSEFDSPRRDNSLNLPRKRDAEQLLFRLSGSDLVAFTNSFLTGSREAFVNETYTLFDVGDVHNIGRTIGIEPLTGTVENRDFALSYRLTGTLADISGSNPGWLTNNRFGMPWIPISSASLVEGESTPPTSINPQTILTQRAILDSARRLTDAARDVNPSKTLIEQFDVALSGTAI